MPEPQPLVPLTPTQRVLRVAASPVFNALLDFVLENPSPRTNPEVVSVNITSDGFLQAANSLDPTRQGFIGTAEDFDRNLTGICGVVGLTPDEITAVRTQAYSRITDWRKRV